MLRICCAVALAAISAHAQAPAPAQPAAPPSTDVYLVSLPSARASWSDAAPQAMATERGYENQPFFAPDNNNVLFTANRDGKQTDIFEFDRTGRKTRQVVSTPEGEYSPTFTPDGKAFSVIRVESDGTQRLWRFDRNGANPRVLLADVKPVGYHAWLDGDRLALFILGKPNELAIARVSTGVADRVVSGIGRSIHRIPGKTSVSFVSTREVEGAIWVNEYEPATKTTTPLVKVVPGSTDRDCAWLPDGTLLMSSGTRVFAWTKGSADWREVYDVARHHLGNVSRVAVSPDGRTLALVVLEPKR